MRTRKHQADSASTYRTPQDGDGDGKICVATSLADAAYTAAKHLRSLGRNHRGDWSEAIASYNGGTYRTPGVRLYQAKVEAILPHYCLILRRASGDSSLPCYSM